MWSLLAKVHTVRLLMSVTPSPTEALLRHEQQMVVPMRHGQIQTGSPPLKVSHNLERGTFCSVPLTTQVYSILAIVTTAICKLLCRQMLPLDNISSRYGLTRRA